MQFIDASLPHRFCPSLLAAEQQAMREAADTAGIVLRVKSLRVESNRVVIVGLIPPTSLVFEHPPETPGYLEPRSIGNLHLTWSSLLRPSANDEIGYLVLQTPVAAAGRLPESEDDDSYWVALAIERTFHSMPPGSIGAACCARCNRPIPPKRLTAVPNTRVCTNCQQKKEKR